MKVLVSLMSIAVSLGVAAPAGADTPDTTDPVDCSGAWWEARDDLPLVVDNAPRRPTVLLPIRWSSNASVALVHVVSAELSEPGGATVPGRVIHNEPTIPEDVVIWRPDSPLELEQTYELRLKVSDPPASMAAECGFSGFEQVVTVTTGDGSSSDGALTLVALTSRVYAPWSVVWSPQYCSSSSPATCNGVPTSCCRIETDLAGYSFEGQVKVNTLESVSTDSFRLDMALHTRGLVRYLSTTNNVKSAETYVIRHSPSAYEFSSGICLTATLTNVTEGHIVSTVSKCGAERSSDSVEPPSSSDYCREPTCEPDGAGSSSEPNDLGDSGCSGGAPPWLGLLLLVVVCWRRRVPGCLSK